MFFRHSHLKFSKVSTSHQIITILSNTHIQTIIIITQTHQPNHYGIKTSRKAIILITNMCLVMTLKCYYIFLQLSFTIF